MLLHIPEVLTAEQLRQCRMVRDDGERSVLFDLDQAIQRLIAERADHPQAIALTGIYHNCCGAGPRCDGAAR